MKLPLLLPVLLLAACTRHLSLPDTPDRLAPSSDEFTVQRELRFVPADWPQALHGDLYLPAGEGPHPTVLAVHGGGWSSRSRADMDGVAETLVRNGYAVFNVSYRFAPEFTFPAQVHDVQQAVRWLREHADAYDLDAGRIAGYGYSSGAHLVAMLATLGPGDTHFGGPETRLQAAVLGGAPSDLRAFTGGSLVPDFLGTTHEEGYATFVAASPITYVSADDTPSFNYHGGFDLLVDADYAEAMHLSLIHI